MTNPTDFPDLNKADAGSAVDRRGLLKGAAALAATALVATDALGPRFRPRRRTAALSRPRYRRDRHKRFKAKVGNTSIKRLYTGCLWAEGPAWNAEGQYLVWSDIPD